MSPRQRPAGVQPAATHRRGATQRCPPARLGGYSRCACMMTCTSLLLPGSTMPLLGRTQYFLGLVVLTLKATRSPVGFCRVNVHGTFLRSSNLRGGARGSQQPRCVVCGFWHAGMQLYRAKKMRWRNARRQREHKTGPFGGSWRRWRHVRNSGKTSPLSQLLIGLAQGSLDVWKMWQSGRKTFGWRLAPSERQALAARSPGQRGAVAAARGSRRPWVRPAASRRAS